MGRGRLQVSDWTCPTCGQAASKPPWLRAREAGFDGDKHCRMMANKLGKVVPCVGGTLEYPWLCEVCPINLRFTKLVVVRGVGTRVWNDDWRLQDGGTD